MEPNGLLTRRRLVTLTAITGASLALAGCGADQLPAETETETEAATETPTPTATPTVTPTETGPPTEPVR